MSEATRRDMRACPANDRCLALESSRRVLSLASDTVRAAAPSPYSAYVAWSESIDPSAIQASLQNDDGTGADRPHRAARRPQLPAHQPNPAPLGNPVRRLAQQDRATPRARAVDRDLAAVFRPRSCRRQDDDVQKRARVLHAGAARGGPADRPRSGG